MTTPAIGFKTTLDAKQLSRALLDLGRTGTETAVSQAINRTLKGIRTDATRYLSDEIETRTRRVVRDRTEIERSTRRRLRGALVIKPKSLPLSQLKGVRVSKRAGVRWRGKRLPNAFRIKGQVGALKDDIFIRKRGVRSPLRAYGYTLMQEYRHLDTDDELRGKTRTRLRKEFDRAVAFQLRKRGFR